MSSTQIASSFVEDAPPGELSNVINGNSSPESQQQQATYTSSTTLDIKALTPSDTNLVSSLSPAITKYHQTHFSTVKLPNASNSVLVSPYNHLGESRYYDSASNKSFVFDPVAQTASDVQSYEHETRHADVVPKLLKGLKTHAEEHYPAAVVGVFAVDDDGDKVALVLVSNKYSPNNFWYVRSYSSTRSLLSPTISIKP
jgi:capping protein alpha